jgi:type I restriction enzyme S subunit
MKGYFQTVLNNHVNQASVASKRLLETPIDVPPFDEQQRIVIALESYFARLKDGLAGLQRASALLSSWREATLVRAFRGRLVEEDLSEGDACDLHSRFAAAAVEGPWALPYPWIWRRLGDLFSVSIGATPSRSDASLWGGGIPWVSSGEVAFNHIDHTRETISIAALPDPGSRIHPPGTVMLAMIGEGKTRGQAAILDISAAHNQNCASIRVSETSVLPEYIYWLLQLRYNENRQAASGGNQPALNKSKVENILVPLAPLGTQRKIVSILENVDLQIARTADTVQGATTHAQNLKKKIYNTAFSGLLGSNGSEP